MSDYPIDQRSFVAAMAATLVPGAVGLTPRSSYRFVGKIYGKSRSKTPLFGLLLLLPFLVLFSACPALTGSDWSKAKALDVGANVIADYNLQNYIPIPVAGVEPVTEVNRVEVKGTVVWKDANGTVIWQNVAGRSASESSRAFAAGVVYQAEITLEARDQYSFHDEAVFKYYSSPVKTQPGDDVKNSRIRSFSVTYLPAVSTEASKNYVLDYNLQNCVPVPMVGGKAETLITRGDLQADVAWSKVVGNTTETVPNGASFEQGAVYKATITLNERNDYEFDEGIPFFYPPGAVMDLTRLGQRQYSVTYLPTTVANLVNEYDLSTVIIPPLGGNVPSPYVLAPQYSGLVLWTPSPQRFEAGVEYTATALLFPAATYSFNTGRQFTYSRGGATVQSSQSATQVTVNIVFSPAAAAPLPTERENKGILKEESLILLKGATEKLVPNAAAVTGAVTWSSENKNIVVVYNDGMVYGKAVGGPVNVTAVDTLDTWDIIKVMVVDENRKDSKLLGYDSLSLEVGQERILTAYKPQGTPRWFSSDEDVVTVNNAGKITGKASGTALVTVVDEGDNWDTVTIIVLDGSTGGGTNKHNPNLIDDGLGNPLPIEVGDSPINLNPGNTGGLQWWTSDEKVITVDENGVISPVGEGDATITVVDENGYWDTIDIKVEDPTPGIVGYDPAKDSPLEFVLMVGQTKNIPNDINIKPNQSAVTKKYHWVVKTDSPTGAVSISGSDITGVVGRGTATIALMGENTKEAATVNVRVYDTVTGIKNMPTELPVGQGLTLPNAVQPSGANQDITWKLVSADTTGMAPDNDPMKGLTASTASGTVVVEASVPYGAADGTVWKQQFAIKVYGKVTSITLGSAGPVIVDASRVLSLALSGTVIPPQASGAPPIVWSVKNANDSSGAQISNNNGTGILTVTSGGNHWDSSTKRGKVTVTATIADGNGPGSPYTKDFDIPIFVPVTGIDNLPAEVKVLEYVDLSGTIQPPLNSSSQSITWALVNPPSGVTLTSGNHLAVSAGVRVDTTIRVKAIIANGKSPTEAHEREWDIKVVDNLSGNFDVGITFF